jgi:hypothetical protein
MPIHHSQHFISTITPKMTQVVRFMLLCRWIRSRLLVGFDFYALFKWGEEATISYQVIQATYNYPVLAFAAGFVCGHLFWQIRAK